MRGPQDSPGTWVAPTPPPPHPRSQEVEGPQGLSGALESSLCLTGPQNRPVPKIHVGTLTSDKNSNLSVTQCQQQRPSVNTKKSRVSITGTQISVTAQDPQA